MMRTEDVFEFKSSLLQAVMPGFRQYHVVEQVFELPLWKVQTLPNLELDDDPAERRWRRYISSSMRGMLGIARHPDWKRVRIDVVLPGYMTPEGEMQLARCTAVWEGIPDEENIEATWIFETDRGTFADPEFGNTLEGIHKGALAWKDFEDDYDEQGQLKM